MKEKQGWFDHPKNRSLFLKLFYSSLVLLVLLDLFVEKHPFFGFDGLPGFSALFGFVSCGALVLAARAAGMVLMRDEGYYDD